MIFQLILLFFLIFTAIYLYFKKQYAFWGKLGFPHTDPIFPWGDVQGLFKTRSISQVMHDIYKQFPNERFVGFSMIFVNNILIRDPELIKSVLVKDFGSFHDRGININEDVDPLSGHLFSVAGAKWKAFRTKITPSLTSGKMKMMFPILAKCSENFKKVLDGPAERGEVIEVKDYTSRFSTDVITLAAFGVETDCIFNPDNDFRRYGEKIFSTELSISMRAFLQLFAPKLGRLLKVRVIRKDVSEFFLNAFRESMEYREGNNINRNDFFDILIQLKQKGHIGDADGDSASITFNEAAGLAFGFFGAGFETSSTTMQFALYELAKNPEVQERAREEVLRVLAKHNGQVTYECVQEMEYLGRVIDETLRMYPPIPILQRQCNKNWAIPNSQLVVPKGTTIIIDCVGLHRDEKYFPNPDQFDPDRFTEEGRSSRHNYSYLPFGEGPRSCIAMRFGLMQTRVGMMTLLSNFRFSPARNSPTHVVYNPESLILTPKDGMYITITKI